MFFLLKVTVRITEYNKKYSLRYRRVCMKEVCGKLICDLGVSVEFKKFRNDIATSDSLSVLEVLVSNRIYYWNILQRWPKRVALIVATESFCFQQDSHCHFVLLNFLCLSVH